MSKNPYDRRDRPNVASEFADASWSARHVGPRESPVSFRELEAMVQSAWQRGNTEGREMVERDIPRLQQQAWDDGYRVGDVDGAQRIIRRVERSLEEVVDNVRNRAMLDGGANALAISEKKMTKLAMRVVTKALHDLGRELLTLRVHDDGSLSVRRREADVAMEMVGNGPLGDYEVKTPPKL